MIIKEITIVDKLVFKIIDILRPDLNRSTMPTLFDEYFEKIKASIFEYLIRDQIEIGAVQNE